MTNESELGDVYRPPQKTTSTGPPWTRAHRLAVTIVVPVVVVFARRFLTLPGVNVGSLESRATEGLMALFRPHWVTSAWGVFALGLAPWIGGSVLAEIAAVVVPSWRKLRHGGFEGRRKLGVGATIVAFAIAAFQAYTLLRYYLSANVELSPSFVWTTIPTLLAGMALLVVAAHAITKYGLVNGVALLWAIEAIPGDATGAHLVPGQLGTAIPLLLPLGFAFAIAAFLGRERQASERGHAFDIPMPATGLAVGLGSSVAIGLSAAGPSLPLMLAVFALLYAGVGVFANRPRLIAALWAKALRAKVERGALARRHAVAAVAWGLGWNLAIGPLGKATDLGGLFRAIVFASLVFDAASELDARGRGDLVAVFPEHRPYALPVARDLLAANRIALFVRSRRTRPLFSFFGPFIPMELCVDRADATRATKLLEKLLMGSRHLGEKAKLEGEPAPPWPSWKSPRLLALVGLLVASIGFARFQARSSTPPEPRAHHPRTSSGVLAMIAVDDSKAASDAVAGWEKSLPVASRLSTEFLDARSVAFILAWPKDGESLDAATARFSEWLDGTAAAKLPPRDRFAIGLTTEHDPDGRPSEPLLRTYVVSGDPILTDADVIDAGAAVSQNGGVDQATVMVTFDERGATVLEAWTSAHVRERLAIVVRGRVESAPVVQSRIPGGQLQLTMGEGPIEERLAEAKRLAAALRGEL